MSHLYYTIYDNKTDMPVATMMTAEECANAMGIKLSSFHTLKTRCNAGVNRRWSFITHSYIEALLENCELSRSIPPVLKVSGLAKVLGISKNCADSLLRRPDFPTIRATGKRRDRMVTRDDLIKWYKNYLDTLDE